MRLARFISSVVLAAILATGWIAFGNTPDPNRPMTSTFPSTQDTLSARFVLCVGPVRRTCVVDGDTFWLGGVKIRIADIDAPEISKPGCDRELRLGDEARDRLLELLNAGSFSLATGVRDEDRYGRKLRTLLRGGASVGEQLVAEGLARRWQDPRRDWCATR